MNRVKRLLLLLITILTMIAVCGCLKDASKESEAEYIAMMKDYMEEKYSVSFDIVESVIHSRGFSGMELNTLVLRDGDGCITNVRAKTGDLYNFYDDYAQARTADKILSDLTISKEHIDAFRIYVAVNNHTIESIDTSPENVSLLIAVGKISEAPNDANLQALYEVYKQICSNGYKEMSFRVGFVKESSDFDAAVENLTLHGKPKQSDYNGEFYAYLRTTSVDLSFEDFKNCIEK